jgi:CheY-like chemotaxis protein
MIVDGSGRRVLVVDGDTILERLRSFLPECEALGNDLKSGDVIVVIERVAGSLTAGLERLRTILTSIDTEGTVPLSLVTLAWTESAPRDLPTWLQPPLAVRIRLPIGAGVVSDVLSTSLTPLSDEQRRALRERAFESRLEDIASDIRHSYRGLAAAVRIYLGALIEGTASRQPAKADLVFSSLTRRLVAAGEEEASIVAHQEFLRILRAYRAKGPTTSVTGRLPDLFMLDDNGEAHGWTDVLRSIAHTARATTRWDHPEAGLKQALERGDLQRQVLLLDCNLGMDQPTGLELLPAIRDLSITIPIVFMTAYDDAQLALWAMRSGANQFFVKELSDAGDRGSQSYFRRFSEVCQLAPVQRRVSDLWWQYAGRGPSTAVTDAFVRLSFYVLMTHADGIEPWAWGLSHPRTRDEDSRVGRVVCICLWHAFQRDTLPIRHARHGGAVSINDALAQLKNLIAELPQAAQAAGMQTGLPQWPTGCPFTPSDLRVETPFPGTTVTDERLGLTDAAVRGTLELEGALDAQGPDQITPDDGQGLLVADTRGSDTGWFQVLRRMWPEAVFVETPQALELLAGDARAVILDPFFPTLDSGIRCLRNLKSAYPALPVLALSGSTTALPAIRCLRAGALDVLPKAMAQERGSQEADRFLRDLKARVVLALSLGRGPLRQLWARYEGFRTGSPLGDALTNRLASLREQARALRVAVELPKRGEWRAEIEAELELALAICTRLIWQDASEPHVPPFDSWRLKTLFTVDPKQRALLMVWLVMPIVERLAQWHHCLTHATVFEIGAWGGKPGVNITSAMDRLSPAAAKLWALRNSEAPSGSEIQTMSQVFDVCGAFGSEMKRLEQKLCSTA